MKVLNMRVFGNLREGREKERGCFFLWAVITCNIYTERVDGVRNVFDVFNYEGEGCGR